MVNAIEVNGLRKSYDSFEAVKGISFAVPTGQVFAFLGPNGAGKTTTVEILEGYRDRTSGDVSVLGDDPSKQSRESKERIGIVLQECGFPRFASVRELVELQSHYYPHPRNVDEVIKLVGLEDKGDVYTRALSGGQRRRLDLALALVGDPDLIFLDEPTTGFDPNARREAWETIANLRDLGKTIFLTTHYMDEAQYLADYIVVLAGGEIVAEGPPNTLGGRDSAASEVSFLLTDGLSLSDLPRLDGEHVSESNRSVLIRTDTPTKTLNVLTNWAIGRGMELQSLDVSKPSLEAIYLELTAEPES